MRILIIKTMAYGQKTLHVKVTAQSVEEYHQELIELYGESTLIETVELPLTEGASDCFCAGESFSE